MKEYMKAYHMFFARKSVKYIIYLAEPLVIILLVGIGRFVSLCWNEGMAFMTVEITVCYLFSSIEVMADILVFKGIGIKRNRNLEYLKTSAKWKSLLQKGLVFDTVRRFLSAAFIVVVSAFLVCSKADAVTGEIMPFFAAAAVVAVCLFCTVVLWVMRCIENVYVLLAAIYLMYILLGAVFSTISHGGIWLGIIIGTVLWIGAVVMQIRGITKRVGGSFYDE